MTEFDPFRDDRLEPLRNADGELVMAHVAAEMAYDPHTFGLVADELAHPSDAVTSKERAALRDVIDPAILSPNREEDPRPSQMRGKYDPANTDSIHGPYERAPSEKFDKAWISFIKLAAEADEATWEARIDAEPKYYRLVFDETIHTKTDEFGNIKRNDAGDPVHQESAYRLQKRVPISQAEFEAERYERDEHNRLLKGPDGQPIPKTVPVFDAKSRSLKPQAVFEEEKPSGRPAAVKLMDEALRERPDLTNELAQRVYGSERLAQNSGKAAREAHGGRNGEGGVRSADRSLFDARTEELAARRRLEQHGPKAVGPPPKKRLFAKSKPPVPYGEAYTSAEYDLTTADLDYRSAVTDYEQARRHSEQDDRTSRRLEQMWSMLENRDLGPTLDGRYEVSEDVLTEALETSHSLLEAETEQAAREAEAALFRQTYGLATLANELNIYIGDMEQGRNNAPNPLHSNYGAARAARANIVEKHNIALQRWQLARLLNAERYANGSPNLQGRIGLELTPDRALVYRSRVLHSSGSIEGARRDGSQVRGDGIRVRSDGSRVEAPTASRRSGNPSVATRGLSRAVPFNRRSRRTMTAEGATNAHQEAMREWWNTQGDPSAITTARRTGQDAIRVLDKEIARQEERLKAYDNPKTTPVPVEPQIPTEPAPLTPDATPEQQNEYTAAQETYTREVAAYPAKVEAYRQAQEAYNQGRREIVEQIARHAAHIPRTLFDVFYLDPKNASVLPDGMAKGTASVFGEKDADWQIAPKGNYFWRNGRPYDPLAKYRPPAPA